MAPLNFAVIGFGMSAKVFHIPLIRSLGPQKANLHTILQRSGDECEKLFPHAKHYRTLDEVLADKDVDVVVITSIPDTHFPFAKATLEAGKHVIVEKPFTARSSEAEKLCKLAQDKNLVLAVYQNRRWDSDFLTLRSLLSPTDGSPSPIGTPVLVESHFDRYVAPGAAPRAAWKEAGGEDDPIGFLYDLGSHLIDQAVTLFGPPSTVSARLSAIRAQLGHTSSAADDDFYVTLTYSHLPHLTVVLAGTALSATSRQLRFKVRGDKGSWEKYGTDPQEDQLKAGLRPVDDDGKLVESYGVESDLSLRGILTVVDASSKPLAFESKPVETKRGTYLVFYENVFDAIQKRKRDELAVKPEEARDAIRVLELARKSAKEGRVVKWDEK